jgi:hypothetical protein
MTTHSYPGRAALSAGGTALGLLLALSPGLSAHAAGASAFLADGRTLEQVTVRPGPGPEEVSLQPAGGATVVVSNRDLHAIDFGRIAGKKVVPTLRLVNGDQVYGAVSFPSPRLVKVAAGWGGLTVPIAWCSAVRLDPDTPMPEPAAKDALVLAGDRVEGAVQGVSGGKVQFEVSGKPVPLELSRVRAIVFGPRNRTPGPNQGLGIQLDLGGGERLSGQWLKMDEDILSLRLAWGDTLDVPVASISRLEVQNGRLVYLSTLRPSETRATPFLDRTFPIRADSAVSGRPLRLRGRTYVRGLGVHSRTEVTYQLDGTFRTFAATLGVDDAVGSQGSVVYRVFGDEKLLFESPVLRGGGVPHDLKLEIRKVLLLRLEVDFADGGDAGDHADWADARLLKD